VGALIDRLIQQQHGGQKRERVLIDRLIQQQGEQQRQRVLIDRLIQL
jgi:hypothetical protein